MSFVAALAVEERVENAFGFSSKQMDKLYKSLFLNAVKRLMAARLPEFEAFKLPESAPGREIFVGSVLYRRRGMPGRCAWLKWEPGPGVERYFFVMLGWSAHAQSLPHHPGRDERLYSARGPIPDLPGGCIHLEQLEGKGGIGPITIPSPWDQLLLVKAAAPRAQHVAAQQKAFAEAQALTEADRVVAVEARLDDVFTRLEVQLPAFLSALS
jgi:hypothetical protein